MNIQYLRNPRVTEKTLDQSCFLANPDNDKLFYLNSMGSAIWRLLQQPTGEEYIVRLLATAFPQISEKELTDSVASLLAELQRDGLIEIFPSDQESDSADTIDQQLDTGQQQP